MKQRVLACAAATLASCTGSAAHAECKLQMLANIPILFVSNVPMIEATINGKHALLRFSLGRSLWIWGPALKEYGLKLDYPARYRLGIGDASTVLINELKVSGGIQKDVHYDVAANAKNDGEAGLYGNELFNGENDVELDFAHNAVRIFKPDGCKGDEVVYWGGPFSVAQDDISGKLSLKLAGKAVSGAFAPGNEVTFVTSVGAERAGISLRKAGILPAGMVDEIGTKPIDVSIGTFREIAIGDEVIKNVPLAVGNVLTFSRAWGAPEVILGADFARTHRIYFAQKQRKIYFSYGGGSPFQDIYARLGLHAPTPPAQAAAP